MATINASTNEKVYNFSRWYGLNEAPDGDTRLRLGEASKIENWKVTRDGNLKRRPGTETLFGLCSSYTGVISKDIMRLASFSSGDDKLVVYSAYSATKTPGTISLVGYSGLIQQGTWSEIDVSIADGEMTEGETAFTVEDGVLRVTTDVDGVEYTINELVGALAELDEGEFLYVYVEEEVYAIDSSCLKKVNNGYELAGYLVSAVPNQANQPVAGMWSGYAGGKQRFLAACNGKIWSLYDPDTNTFKREYLGDVATDKGVNFIPFGGDVYIQNGHEYYVYNGLSITTVTGYIPLVAISIGPTASADAGDLTEEYVNLLIPKRRVWLSPDGNTNKTFRLPEKYKSIDKVVDLATGNTVATTSYSWTANTDTITFSMTLAKAVNSLEVWYTVYSHSDNATIPDYRAQVTSNLYAELYSGSTDTRLFIYGNGTNKALYSGMDGNGQARADYFPDTYEVRVGDSNTPITSMIRHYSELVCYKTNECWAMQYGQVELANGSLTVAVYVTPVNRDKGNVALGQVRLVENSPVTCSGTELYHWINSSYYTSSLSRDERQARRISDRVQASIKNIDFNNCMMWDDNDNQEFYIAQGGTALVWNYAMDAWYKYTGFDAVRMCNFLGDLYVGTSDGLVLRMTYTKNTDSGKIIKANWESGALDFGAGHMRKHSSVLWVGLKPEEGTSVDVCVETDRKNTFKDKVVSSTKAKVPGEPFMVKTKIKAKKFVYYRLKLSVDEKMPAVTVTNVDIRVRQTGYAK